MRLIAAALLLLLLAAVPASGGELAPGLERQLAGWPADQPLRVLVVMRDQADIRALDRDLHAAKAPAAVRHRQVIEALRASAGRGQAALVADLAAAKASGGVLGATPHWLLSSVVVTATPDAVRALALRPDVARVEADLVVELIAPLPSDKIADPAKDAGVGLVPGVEAVGAPRVWRELGIDGTGVVVGILDTGVDGTHPALASRWRGNFAPAAECWFDGAGLGDDVPVDRHYHGTHVMGTVTGQAPGDTIGVAPGALWIASNVINSPGTQEEFDNAVLASLEFMADPDGNPATTADVPAVVHNSWGINEAYGDYLDCDSRWWDAIDAVEAAGVVLTWAAGNEGPSAGTVRSPADRATTAVNAFAVGSVSPLAPFTVSTFSSRGPSGCGGAEAIKPEVVAPGENILSARPGGGYQYLSGTSMAGPHVAGIVALMRASNPNADVATIKQALLDTARDLGAAGQDNDSGWGLVDAYAAVMAVMDGVGEVAGIVTDQADGAPVAGAVVQLDGGYHRAVTGSDGRYRIVLPAGAATFTISAFGYVEGSLPVTVPDGGATAGDVVLVRRPPADVTGVVTGPEGELVSGATVTAEGTPVVPAVTGADGRYVLPLPSGAGVTYGLRVRAPGYGSAFAEVEVAGPLVHDFTLPPRSAEDFETGDFGAYPWRHTGDAPWEIVDTGAFEGAHCARSGAIGNLGLSGLALDFDVADEGDLVFRVRVSSEARYDALRFYLDGVVQGVWTGDTAWTEYAVTLPAGPHALAWSYEKDASVSGGDDAAWLDFIEFPARAIPPAPVATLDLAALAITLPPGGHGLLELGVGNAGDAPLQVGASVGALPAVAAAENPVRHLNVRKTGEDPRLPVTRVAGIGGPDLFGYAWRDSDHPYGPAFAWPDIAAAGTAVALGDDAVSPPFDLGFVFPFYGLECTQVRVCSNGFVSFGPATAAWANQGMPDPLDPNNIVAPFWDDLAPNLGGSIHVLAGADRFTVQFTGVPHYGRPDVTETFAVVLHAGGAIELQYLEVGDDGSCSVGIENAWGSDGLLVQFNSAGSLHDAMAIRIAADAPPAWLAATPAAAVVAAGAVLPLQVAVEAAGLAVGDHDAFVSLVTNDPVRPVLAVPVTLTISELAVGPRLPAAVTFAGAVPNPCNPSAELRFALPHEATVALELYDLRGRRVRTVFRGVLGAGDQALRWDGRDDAGRDAASGAYVARLVVDGTARARTLTLLR
ncbi:MAG TPA: S8 family serine peptidase [Candidatus Krumholzibacteria bacterium]|nr:S8 family serine peptidase [Candidatus Krumholzibacteria bacterium]